MRLLLGALLLLIAGIKCGKYEDAKELVSSFKSVVDIPLSKDFSFFAKRLAPFGELFASALQVGLEEDLLGDLLTLTTGIDDNVKDLTRQQEYIFHSTIFQDLKRDYELHVAKPIGFFLRQIGFMSERRMNVSQAVIDGFTHECTTANSPLEIAIELQLIVKKCGKPIMHNSSDQLFDLFHSTSFHDYTPLKAEEEHLFNQYFALLSFWLANRPAKLFSLKSFGVNHKKKKTKLALLEFLMEKFGIDKTGTAETECLPKAAFLAHRYKRDSIQHIADLLMEHVTALEYATVFCANISNYNDPDGANAYVRKVGKELEPVQVFIANWFEALLESTWPKKESFLIRDAINDFSKGTNLPESNQTYNELLQYVHNKMRGIGHPSYGRQYVATRQRSIGPLSSDFAFDCRPGSCTNSSAMNAHVISIRSRTDTNNVYSALDDLVTFRNNSFGVFWGAMDKELYRYSFVARAIAVLAEKYGLDLKQFNFHSSYIVLRKDAYRTGCSNDFAMKCDEDLENTFLQTMEYHEDGSKLTDCEDWVVILAL